jgi:hypothetical protein
MMTSARTRYAGYRFPSEIISHAVWLWLGDRVGRDAQGVSRQTKAPAPIARSRLRVPVITIRCFPACTGARRKKRAPVDARGPISERTEIVRYDAAAAQRSQNLPKPTLAEPSSPARGEAVAVLRCPPSQHS